MADKRTAQGNVIFNTPKREFSSIVNFNSRTTFQSLNSLKSSNQQVIQPSRISHNNIEPVAKHKGSMTTDISRRNVSLPTQTLRHNSTIPHFINTLNLPSKRANSNISFATANTRQSSKEINRVNTQLRISKQPTKPIEPVRHVNTKSRDPIETMSSKRNFSGITRNEIVNHRQTSSPINSNANKREVNKSIKLDMLNRRGVNLLLKNSEIVHRNKNEINRTILPQNRKISEPTKPLLQITNKTSEAVKLYASPIPKTKTPIESSNISSRLKYESTSVKFNERLKPTSQLTSSPLNQRMTKESSATSSSEHRTNKFNPPRIVDNITTLSDI